MHAYAYHMEEAFTGSGSVFQAVTVLTPACSQLLTLFRP